MLGGERVQEVAITTEYIKLDSFLKLCGVSGTGGQSKMLIADGQVLVDGQICTMRGRKLYPGVVVQVMGESFKVAVDLCV